MYLLYTAKLNVPYHMQVQALFTDTGAVRWLCDTITFACIPACTAVANAIRYEEFAEEVCRLTGATNAYKAITIEGERLAVHENQNGKNIESVHIIKFNRDFFNGKRCFFSMIL